MMDDITKVIRFLNERGLSVTTAESCTAGLVAAFMADVSGCGNALHSGYVVYTEEAKNTCLGVRLQTIHAFGLTSEEVAMEMAIGALHRSAANLIVAITGMAESDDCLSGVICFAYGLKTQNGYRLLSETKKFEGSRNSVRKSSAIHAILSLPDVYEKIQSYPEINTINAEQLLTPHV
ncbi:MAG: nicotinamide-nucleotide amidohydrolase family protein [Cellvibrio sp.]|uniref:CinA family protein n=1 Tax=Cellvibrio sp. TaxID=1965322 RepID=UPI0031A32C1D